MSGDWHIKTEKKGTYRFEVRRWPKEVYAPIADIPSIEGNVDAWDSKGGKSYLIYGNEKAPFVAFPVASARLRVGDFEHLKTVNSGDAKATFDVPLDRNEFTVTAELLNSRNEVLAGAYYTYCSRIR